MPRGITPLWAVLDARCTISETKRPDAFPHAAMLGNGPQVGIQGELEPDSIPASTRAKRIIAVDIDSAEKSSIDAAWQECLCPRATLARATARSTLLRTTSVC